MRGYVLRFPSFPKKEIRNHDVDDVGGERRLRQLVELDVEGGLADHAAAGGVDDHRRAFQSAERRLPRSSGWNILPA